MSARKRPDGRPRFGKDKGLIGLLLANGTDPRDPGLRPQLVAQFAQLLGPGPAAERRADDLIADLYWGLAGFPTV